MERKSLKREISVLKNVQFFVTGDLQNENENVKSNPSERNVLP